MTETTKAARSGRQQNNNDNPRVVSNQAPSCMRGTLFLGMVILLMLEVGVGVWFANTEEINPHQSWGGSSTSVQNNWKVKPENRTFTRRQQPKIGTPTSKTSVEKIWKVKPENRTVTRRQQQRNDCYETANKFDFPEHGCSVMNARIHCQFSSLRLNTSKIISQARGGEPLQSVLGQAENAEYLSYTPGAFSVTRPFEHVQSNNQKFYHYMSDVLGSLQVINTLSDEKELQLVQPPCSTTWKGTTLFLTRYEYVNLYHTLTDWWNTFYSLPTKKKKNGTNNNVLLDLPINIVLLDAHPQGNLDSVWQMLLGGNVTYARHLQDELVCFETARFIPAGYASPLFPGHTNCPPKAAAAAAADGGSTVAANKNHGQGTAFVDFFLSTYHLRDVKRIPGRVVVIDRVPYIAHPRAKLKNTERVVANLKDLAMGLPAHFSNSSMNYTTPVTVKVVTLVADELGDQIKSIREADVLVANHGAGLTHSIFLDASAHVVEMSCMRGFFGALLAWRPDIHHHCQPSANKEISSVYWQKYVLSVIESVLQSHEEEKAQG